MKLKPRTVQQWLEIEHALNRCHYNVRMMEQDQDHLQQLLPEVSEDIVADLANDVISFNSLINVDGDGTVFKQDPEGQATANQTHVAVWDARYWEINVGGGVAECGSCSDGGRMCGS